tara:strand:+ start:3471 stop:4274 length:804 start_codon:yes stop_codon:yes gene_type:complete
MIVKKRLNTALILGLSIISFQHLILKLSDLNLVKIDNHWQFMHKNFLNNFFDNILFFHANPPLLSFISYISSSSYLGLDKYQFLGSLLVIMHLLSFLIFYQILVKIKFKYGGIASIFIFSNPLMLMYFSYPFSSTYIFFLILLFILNLYSDKTKGTKFIYATLILSIISMFRASYHIVIILGLLIPLIKGVEKKYIIIASLIFFIPLSWYIKNSIMFGKFSASTWIGMNLAVHINTLKTENKYYHQQPEKILYLNQEDQKNLSSKSF